MKEQNPGLNLLAIISLSMMLLYSFVDKMYVDYSNIGINTSYHMFLKYLACIGMNVIVFISFYYMQTLEIKVSLLLKKEFTLIFYSLFGLLFFSVYLQQSELVPTMYNILPLITSKYWFITDYILVCILSPFINNYMDSVTVDINKYFVIINVFLWSVIPTVASIFIGNQINIVSYSRILWLLTLYYIAFCFRKHVSFINAKIFNGIGSALTCLALLILSSLVFKYLSLNFAFFKDKTAIFCTENNILIVLCALNLFVEFGKMKIEYISKSALSSIYECLFGTYIFFNNEYLLNLIDVNIFSGALFADSSSYTSFIGANFILFSFIIFILVIVFCFLVEYSRYYLIEEPMFIMGKNIYIKCKEIKKKKKTIIVYNKDLQLATARPKKKNSKRKIFQINIPAMLAVFNRKGKTITDLQTKLDAKNAK